MSGEGRAPGASPRSQRPSRAQPAASGMQTRRAAAPSTPPSPAVEFPLRVHDAERLEQLLAECAMPRTSEVPEGALRAIATRRAWNQAEQRLDALMERVLEEEGAPVSREGDAPVSGPRGPADQALLASAVLLRRALGEVHRALALHPTRGRGELEAKAWQQLRPAYEWLGALLQNTARDDVAAETPRVPPVFSPERV